MTLISAVNFNVVHLKLNEDKCLKPKNKMVPYMCLWACAGFDKRR
jgi:hypothetical protein